ncbi:hypothetical protein AHiyo1_17960 [Arthrobacter sp. Hiyo1]|nr:hypothetical protein AHiyo1_17960 [Arthrobacter sp. Hiyo1]
MGSPEDHIAAREERVKRRDPQLGGHRLERLDGYQRHCGIHVRGLAEKPVTDDALAAYDVDLLGIRGGHLGGTIACPAEVGMAR